MKMTLARMNYLWLRGDVLRVKLPRIWWNGFAAARHDYKHIGVRVPDAILKKYSEEEQTTFKSGYDYYREVYLA